MPSGTVVHVKAAYPSAVAASGFIGAVLGFVPGLQMGSKRDSQLMVKRRKSIN